MLMTQFTFQRAVDQLETMIQDLIRDCDEKEFDLFTNFQSWQELTSISGVEYRTPREYLGTPETPVRTDGTFYGRLYYKGFTFNIYLALLKS